MSRPGQGPVTSQWTGGNYDVRIENNLGRHDLAADRLVASLSIESYIVCTFGTVGPGGHTGACREAFYKLKLKSVLRTSSFRLLLV